jgi:translation initiation factor 4G
MSNQPTKAQNESLKQKGRGGNPPQGNGKPPRSSQGSSRSQQPRRPSIPTNSPRPGPDQQTKQPTITSTPPAQPPAATQPSPPPQQQAISTHPPQQPPLQQPPTQTAPQPHTTQPHQTLPPPSNPTPPQMQPHPVQPQPTHPTQPPLQTPMPLQLQQAPPQQPPPQQPPIYPGANGHPPDSRLRPPTIGGQIPGPFPLSSLAQPFHPNAIPRTHSAPPSLGEQERALQPVFIPEKTKAPHFFPPPMSVPYYNAPFNPVHPPHGMPPHPTGFGIPPAGLPMGPPTQPISITKKPSTRIPIIDPNTGEEIRISNSPPKGITATPSSTPAPTGLTGYNKPFILSTKPATGTTPPSSFSAPQQAKGVPGGILPELAAQAQPQAQAPQPAQTSPPAAQVPPAQPAQPAQPATPETPPTEVAGKPELVVVNPPTVNATPVSSLPEALVSPAPTQAQTLPSAPISTVSASPAPSPPQLKVEPTKLESAPESQPPVPAANEVQGKEELPKAEAEAKPAGVEEVKPKVEEPPKAKVEEAKPKVEEKEAPKPEVAAEKKLDEKPGETRAEAESKAAEVKKSKKKQRKEILEKANKGHYTAAEFDPYSIAPKPKEQAAKEVAKLKDEEQKKEDSKKSEPVSPASDQPSSPEEKEAGDEDDWEKKGEEELVLKKDEKTPEVSLRPVTAAPFASAGGPSLRPQWAMGDAGGKKMYDRNFLLQFQPLCTERPEGLPPMEVILGYDEGKIPAKEFGLPKPRGGPPSRPPFPPVDNRRAIPGVPMPEFRGPPPGIGRPDRPFGKEMRPPRVQDMRKPKAMKQPPVAPPVAPLVPSANRWVRPQPGNETDLTLNRAKGILNKLTLEKFDPLSDKLLEVGINSADILKGIIALIFDKALSEPKFCSMYAQLCKKISLAKIPEFPSQEPDGKPITFKRVLLNKCQEEFESNQAKAKKVQNKEGLSPEELLETEEKEMRARKGYLGNIKFIGELYKLDMLTEKIMHGCITRLLGDIKHPSEEDMEALCKLMSTIGQRIDHARAKDWMNAYFERIKELVQNPNLPPRIRFMLEDLIELRRNKWVPRRDSQAPKTIKEVHKEAAESERQKELAARLGLRQPAPPVRDMRRPMPAVERPPEKGMPPMIGIYGPAPGRGGPPGVVPPPRQQEPGWEVVGSRRGAPPPELTRKPSTGEIQLAPSGGLTASKGWAPPARGAPEEKYAPRGPLAPPGLPGKPGASVRGPSPAAGPSRVSPPPTPTTSLEKAEEETKLILEEFLSSGDAEEAAVCVRELNCPDFHPDIIQWMILELMEKKDRDRERVGTLFKSVIEKGVMTSEQFAKGTQRVLETLADIVIDIPAAWKHVANIIGQSISDAILPVTFLNHSFDHLVGVGPAPGLAAQMAAEVFRIIGDNKADPSEKELRSLLPKFFKPENRNESYLVKFLEEKELIDLFPTMLVQKQVETMLKDGSSVDSILKWIEHNTPDMQVDAAFARWLMRTVLKEATMRSSKLGDDERAKEESRVLRQYSRLLQRFLSDSIDIQLACLFEVQAFWHSMGLPKGMMERLFVDLYDQDVILEEAFKMWRDDTEDRTPGKQEALFQTHKWLEWLETAEEESDEDEEAKGGHQ